MTTHTSDESNNRMRARDVQAEATSEQGCSIPSLAAPNIKMLQPRFRKVS